MTDFIMQYARAHGVSVLEYAPMSGHTAFRIGGPARYFAVAEAPHLAALCALAQESGLPWTVVGNGSNLLVRDAGYPGLVAKLASGPVEAADGRLEAPAGALLSALAAAAQRHGLDGLAFAQGIPASVGGAVFMNAGAYDGQMSDSLTESYYIDLARPQDGERRLDAAGHRFAYRHSSYMAHPERLITRAVFAPPPGDREAIAQKMAELSARRREKQPLEYPSAGSAYKRPEGHFAGQLIEQAGLKGLSVGGAQVSEKHAGFIINRGGATCADVLALMDRVEQTVLDRFGVRLEREIRLL